MKTIQAALLAVALGALAPGPGVQAAPATNLASVIGVQARARREAASYDQVRAAVVAGQRPAADLETARRSLKAAQVAMYDQIEVAQQNNAALYKDLRRQNARRLEKAQASLVRTEGELAGVDAPNRPPAEARLRLIRELVEGYRQDAERYARPPAAPPRPKLPVLPPLNQGGRLAF